MNKKKRPFWCIISNFGCIKLLHDSLNHFTTEVSGKSASLTGGAYDFGRATTSLTQKLLSSPKKVTLVRHGYSTWNKEGRVQVCS